MGKLTEAFTGRETEQRRNEKDSLTDHSLLTAKDSRFPLCKSFLAESAPRDAGESRVR